MLHISKYAALLGLFSSATIVGYILGHHNSPDATKPETAKIYLALYGRWERLDGDRGKLTLRAGSRTYIYATGDAQVSVSEMSPIEIAREPMPKRDLDKDFEKLIGLSVAETGGASILSTLMQTSEGESVVGRATGQERAAIALMVVATGGLGYFLGHESSPDVTEPKFESELSTDVAVWKLYEKSWRVAYRLAVFSVVHDLDRFKPLPSHSMMNFDKLAESTTVCQKNKELRATYQTHPEICDQVWSDPDVIQTLSKYNIL